MAAAQVPEELERILVVVQVEVQTAAQEAELVRMT
jgi:hypothetical protein